MIRPAGPRSRSLPWHHGIFNCQHDRRYKFYVTESGEGSKTMYKPSSTTFWDNTGFNVTINF